MPSRARHQSIHRGEPIAIGVIFIDSIPLSRSGKSGQSQIVTRFNLRERKTADKADA